jgi:hypothetical protein
MTKMITVDRGEAQAYLNGITDDCDPPYNTPATECEVNYFVALIEEGPGEQEMDSFFQWLDDQRSM